MIYLKYREGVNMSNQVTNKDLHNVLTDMKDNHLRHIEDNTKWTKWLLGAIFIGVVVNPWLMMLMG